MVILRSLLLTLCISLILVACNDQKRPNTSEYAIGNPTAEQILSENEDEDIFVFNDIVYVNAENIDWVNDRELTVGKEVGEIIKQTTDHNSFEDFTATKLTVGTKIYAPVEKGDIYMVIVDGKEIRYLGLREG